jgi:hypothetical protein
VCSERSETGLGLCLLPKGAQSPDARCRSLFRERAAREATLVLVERDETRTSVDWWRASAASNA